MPVRVLLRRGRHLTKALPLHVQGPTKGAEYFAGYILEQSLSVDNLFVFILVFKYFRVPRADQDKARPCAQAQKMQTTAQSR